MVDLVKIRKKARKQESGDRGQVSGGAEATPSAERAGEGAGAPLSPAASTQHSAPSTQDSAPSTQDSAPSTETIPHPSSHLPAPAPAAPDKLARFKATAGRLRESAEEEVAAAQTGQLEVLTFVIAGESYGVDIERIVEIVTPRPITRVPNADPSIVGIISLRGTIVTLLDVRARLRHPTAAETPDTRIIVVDLLGEPVGFEVDRVLRVIKLDAGSVEPHPVVHASELDESIRGVFRHAGALTILLDFDKLLGLRDLAIARA
jgi:purine-binding chemotaxis protein CheW